MESATAHALAQRLSTERFDTYLAACGGDHVRAMNLYTWNIEVSAAFWGPLVGLEVLVRNAIHEQMAQVLCRADWWNDPGISLAQPAPQRIKEAQSRLTQYRRPTGVDDVVAELSFGFWVSLLSKGDDYENQFWRAGLAHAFPRYTGGRKSLYNRLHYLQLLRNRIAHHEQIFGRDLAADHHSILVALGFVCQTTHDWVASSTRVPVLLTRRADTVSGTRKAWF